MTALLIIMGIILFFVLLLSIPVYFNVEYTDSFKAAVSWLFIKIPLYPSKEKKKKKEEPEEEKKEDAKPKKEKDEKPKENILKTFYNNQGVTGIIELITYCASALKKFSVGFIKSIIIKRLRIRIWVTEGDAAQTAVRYGKICGEVYPPLGFICSNCKAKDYNVNIIADYCGEKTTGEFETTVGIVPRSLINAGIGFVFRILGELIKVAVSNIKSQAKNDVKNTNTNYERRN